MDFHLFLDAVEILLVHTRYLHDLTRVNFLCWVDGRTDGLLLFAAFLPLRVYQEVRGELRLTYFAVLALAEHLVHIDDKIVHLTDLWRIAPACVSIISLAPRIRFFPLSLRPLGFVCIFDIGRTLGQTRYHAWNGVVIVTHRQKMNRPTYRPQIC